MESPETPFQIVEQVLEHHVVDGVGDAHWSGASGAECSVPVGRAATEQLMSGHIRDQLQ